MENVVMWSNEQVSMVRFTVHGDPAPQGSKRHVGHGILVEDSKRSRPWRQEVIASITMLEGISAPILGPLHVELEFRLRRPKNHYGTGKNADKLKATAPEYVSSRPDGDKLARTVLDALEQSGLIQDDGQIAALSVVKRYAHRPGLIATVRPLA